MGNKISKQELLEQQRNQKLLEAAAAGQLDDVKRLVAAGADKNTKDRVSEFHFSFTLNYMTLHDITVFTSLYATVSDVIPPL